MDIQRILKWADKVHIISTDAEAKQVEASFGWKCQACHHLSYSYYSLSHHMSESNNTTFQKHGTNTSAIQRSVAFFTQYLEAKCLRTRSPPGMKKSLLQTKNADATTPKIFLDHGGFIAWLTHFLKISTMSATKEKTKRAYIIDELDSLTIHDRRTIASQVSSVQPHKTFTDFVSLLERTLAAQGEISSCLNCDLLTLWIRFITYRFYQE